MKKAIDVVDKIDKALDDGHVWAEVWADGPFVCAEIRGDWKHDHLRADWIVKDMFGADKVLVSAVPVGDDDGDDSYDAVHRYLILD